MKNGKGYIIFPLDVDSETEARHLVSVLRDDVGMFKIGLELFVRCGPPLVKWVAAHSAAGIFLDLKLHDIPATVERAMRAVTELDVSLTTVHCGESPDMLRAAVSGSRDAVKVLGVTVLTSVSGEQLRAAGYEAAMATDVQRLVLHKAEMARMAGCAGVVCSGREVAVLKSRLGSAFLAVTPGIRPDWSVDAKDDQKRVVTPAMAVRQGADYVVIGRPIRDAVDPVAAARRIATEIQSALSAVGRRATDQ